MKKFFKAISNILPEKSDFFLISGIGLIFWGVYQIHIPASFIVAGLLLGAIGFLNALPTNRVV